MGVPAGPSRGRAPAGGVMTIAVGVPIGMGLIATPLCRISAEGKEIHYSICFFPQRHEYDLCILSQKQHFGARLFHSSELDLSK